MDLAIHKAAGPKLMKECAQNGKCGVGQAIATKGICFIYSIINRIYVVMWHILGYQLPAKYVVHTVGPVITRLFDNNII